MGKSDLIDKKELIKFLRNDVNLGTFMKRSVSAADKACAELCKRIEREMPAAKDINVPSKWIPCSERMPEEKDWIGTNTFGTTKSDEVYVTFESPDGQRITRHISFQNGNLSNAEEQIMNVWFKGAKPIAWMPLPEPYRGNE